MLIPFLLVTLVVALPSRAHADRDKSSTYTEVTLAALIGGFDYGKVGGFAGGGHLDLGRHMGNWALVGEYDFIGFGEDTTDPTIVDPKHGYAHRFGVLARRYMQFNDPETFGTWGWVEAGIGVQKLDLDWQDRWVSRRDLAFGFGMEWGGRDLGKSFKAVGMFYALRITVANKEEPPQAGLAAACGGPCDDASGGQPYDFGIFLNWGVNVGF